MILAIQLMIGLMILIGVGIIVITKNIVHAAYALALALLGVAGVYVVLGAELLAVVQIMLYAGGVVILLSFGVMMTSRLRGERVLSESKNQFLAASTSVLLLVLLVIGISSADFVPKESAVVDSQIEAIGISFLTDHIVAFELIAFILLVALVGAAYLAKMAANE